MIESRIGLRLALLALLPCAAGRPALHYRFNFTYAPPPTPLSPPSLGTTHSRRPPRPSPPPPLSPSPLPASTAATVTAAVATTTDVPRLTPLASASQFTPPVRRETRVPGEYLQLQEIRLYDHTGELLDVQALVNGGMATLIADPNSSTPYSQGIDNLFDSDVSECICSYSEYESPNSLPAMHCEACADFTKGAKWIEFNTQEPCEPSTDNKGR